MREFTKSIFGFSWALSLFGVQQTANLLSPAKAARVFDFVTQATEGQISDSLKPAFNAGDRLQRTAVDLTLGFMSGDALNPAKCLKMASDAAKQSADAVTKGVQGFASTMQQPADAAKSPEPRTAAATEDASGARNSSASEPEGWGTKPF